MVIQYEQFKNTIFNLINNSGLDIGAIYYILNSIMSDVEKEYNTTLNREIQQMQQKANANKEESKPVEQKPVETEKNAKTDIHSVEALYKHKKEGK